LSVFICSKGNRGLQTGAGVPGGRRNNAAVPIHAYSGSRGQLWWSWTSSFFPATLGVQRGSGGASQPQEGAMSLPNAPPRRLAGNRGHICVIQKPGLGGTGGRSGPCFCPGPPGPTSWMHPIGMTIRVRLAFGCRVTWVCFHMSYQHLPGKPFPRLCNTWGLVFSEVHVPIGDIQLQCKEPGLGGLTYLDSIPA
jgi:hypothetical protein